MHVKRRITQSIRGSPPTTPETSQTRYAFCSTHAGNGILFRFKIFRRNNFISKYVLFLSIKYIAVIERKVRNEEKHCGIYTRIRALRRDDASQKITKKGRK